MQLGDSSTVLENSSGHNKPAMAVAAAAPPEAAAAHEVDGNSGEEKGREGGGDSTGDKMISFGGNRWPRQETLALLKIRSDMDAVFRDSSLKGPLWEDVSRLYKIYTMPQREEFPTQRLDGAPSDDIGWHFGNPVAGSRNNIECKLCHKIVRGGITRLKQHIAHMKGQVSGCARVSKLAREGMMKLLLEGKAKKNDSKKRKEEFEARLRGEDEDEAEDVDHLIDERMRFATQESLRSHREWEDRQQFRQQTGGRGNIYEQGGSSHASVGGGERPEDITLELRSTNIDLMRSRSMKQPKISKGIMKTLRRKLGEAVSKFFIYERLPMNLANSPWLHNLIVTAAEVGKGVKCPTPYEISDVYLENEYREMKKWLNVLRGTWKEKGVTIMCDGWTDGINHTHIMNFLVYSSKGTIFLKSIDASDVISRNTDYYFQLLDKVVEEVGEEFVVQVVTDNEAALKAAGQKLMEKRPHLYWSACAAHCLDLCLEDIGKKKNVQKLLTDAKTVTNFLYNHIWTVDLMKKYTGGREIVRPGVTRFATQFLQLQAIVQQKQGLRNMFNSEEFRRSKFGKARNGPSYEARTIVNDSEFWSKSQDILKVFEPLVKVLRLVDGDEKPTMGFIYEAVDRAKQAIRQNSRYHSRYNDLIDKRWSYMHSDLHSAGYFLNPQFQYGVEHGDDVYKETFEGTNRVIFRIERNIDDQIKALNQLVLFRDKVETFGTPQAQAAWSKMNPAEWWSFFGVCAPELKRVAIKVLSQTTSATNCERNWSTFSYIHTKTRNRLKYKKLQKLVFTHYNMKLKMRHQMRKSQDEIEASFNPINLDYIFQEDALSPWIEEREDPLLDGVQNAEWLPLVDTDDEDVEVVDDNDDSNEDGGGLSPPSNNSGDGGGDVEAEEGGGDDDGDGDDDGQFQNDPSQDSPYNRRYRSLTDMAPSGSSLPESSRGGSHSRRGKRKQNFPLEDSSSSSIAQSFSDFGIDDSSQSSQQPHPPYYQYPYFNTYNTYASDQAPSYYQPSMNYQDPYHQQSSGGFFDYVFGQGATEDDSQSENRGYEPPRHSTMW